MRFSFRRASLLVAAALALAPAASRAQVQDQSQEAFNNLMAQTSGSTAWQVFKSGMTGSLTSVDLHLLLNCIMPPMCSGDPGALTVEIVETSGDVPTGVVLASGTVPTSAGSTSPAWISVPISPPVPVTNGTVLAIHLSAGGTFDPMTNKWQWAFNQADVYAGTAMFWDIDAGDGLDDPVLLDPNSDATFRTFVSAQVCGNGVEEGTEECDDSNTVGGDGCSAECLDEVCGDGLRTGTEECDDSNATAGDGCSDTCTLEPAAVACRSAIAKGGAKYAAVRMNALLKCKNLLAAGKTLSVADPAECATETGAAKSIGKGAAYARKGIASGKKPKCTDALVGVLYACAETVDGLVDAAATSGCLLSTHDAAVDELLTQYGY
jgi:cysteine-rich repeat protein